MTCSNTRFKIIEDGGFPPITVYDFAENLNIRGNENTSFRWEEVTIKSNYLFEEVTTSGSLEDHGFTYLTQTPQKITVPSTAFSGWYVAGDAAYFIGISGSLFSGYGYAHPIVGDSSIAFFATGVTTYISQTGITTTELESNAKHQMFLTSRSLSGTGYITPYLVGRNGGSIVAYYDPFSGAWVTDQPTGSYPVPSSGYTDIAFDFYPQDFPSTVPDSYDIVVAQLSGATIPVIVDDIHVDKYMARNAFLDYTLPTGYLIQVTPDLGWHNIQSMFDSSDDTNPYLKTFGVFDIQNGNLEDRYDGTVVGTMDSSQIEEAIQGSYRDYLWRAIAVSPNGALGEAGLPQKFKYIGDILDQEFTIANIYDDPLSVTKIVTGTKSERMIILVDGETHEGISYPTNTSWKFILHLQSEKIRLGFQGKDIGGATSSTQYVELSSTIYNQNEKAFWNIFDEFGLLMDIKRLPNESNNSYKNRIKDVIRNPGGPTFKGVANGATRELGLTKIDGALTFIGVKNYFDNFSVKEIDLRVTDYSIEIRTEVFLITEVCRIDPAVGVIFLSKLPKYNSIVITLDNGARVRDDVITRFHENDEYPNIYRLQILDESLFGKFVTVSYDYYEVFLFNDYPTLFDLKTAIENLEDPTGSSFVIVGMNPIISGIESAKGLYKQSFKIGKGVTGSISWTPIYLNQISDRKFRQSFMNSDGTYYNTKFYEYVEELKKKTRIFWEYIETDKDYWVSANIKDEALDHLPTLVDPRINEYRINTSGVSSLIRSEEAWYKGYIGPNGETIRNIGLSFGDFQNGVAHTSDLEPSIYTTFRITESNSDSETFISPRKNNNNVVYFSGQR